MTTSFIASALLVWLGILGETTFNPSYRLGWSNLRRDHASSSVAELSNCCRKFRLHRFKTTESESSHQFSRKRCLPHPRAEGNQFRFYQDIADRFCERRSALVAYRITHHPQPREPLVEKPTEHRGDGKSVPMSRRNTEGLRRK